MLPNTELTLVNLYFATLFCQKFVINNRKETGYELKAAVRSRHGLYIKNIRRNSQRAAAHYFV